MTGAAVWVCSCAVRGRRFSEDSGPIPLDFRPLWPEFLGTHARRGVTMSELRNFHRCSESSRTTSKARGISRPNAKDQRPAQPVRWIALLADEQRAGGGDRRDGESADARLHHVRTGLPLGPPTALMRVSQASPIVAARVKTASPTRATYDVVAPRRAVANAVRTGVVHPKPRPFGFKRV